MKKYIMILLSTLICQIVAAQFTEKIPFMVKNLSAAAIKNVVMETPGGNISVTGASSDARLEVYVSGNGRKENLTTEQIQKRLDEEYELDITTDNNKLSAKAKSKKRNTNWNHSLNISFVVFVPAAVSTDLSTSGGNITLKNLTGQQDFATSGGNLYIANMTGKVKGRTSGGNMKIMHSKAEVDLSTSGGNVDADDVTGKIKLATSGGSVYLTKLNGDVYATTSGGNIMGLDITGELITNTSGGTINLKGISGSLETSTSGGNISVTIKELGKYIKINNSAGNVYLQIPGNKGIDLKLYADNITTDALPNFNGKKDDEEVDGKVNGGGIPVTVHASSGRINLIMK